MYSRFRRSTRSNVTFRPADTSSGTQGPFLLMFYVAFGDQSDVAEVGGRENSLSGHVSQFFCLRAVSEVLDVNDPEQSLVVLGVER